ncbi:hypothetical protein C8Q76DRAFT_487881 [Earliella scabrosa]|nr:hypothetical protein C8Q76DRAFT_487881 [Earliella scabrosa]
MQLPGRSMCHCHQNQDQDRVRNSILATGGTPCASDPARGRSTADRCARRCSGRRPSGKCDGRTPSTTSTPSTLPLMSTSMASFAHQTFLQASGLRNHLRAASTFHVLLWHPSWRALGQSSGITGRDSGGVSPRAVDAGPSRAVKDAEDYARTFLSVPAPLADAVDLLSMWGRGPFVSGRGRGTSETADVVSLRDVRDHRSFSAQELTALFGPVGLDCATRGCRAAFGSRPSSSRAAWWSIESVGTRRVRGKRLDSQTIGYERRCTHRAMRWLPFCRDDEERLCMYV